MIRSLHLAFHMYQAAVPCHIKKSTLLGEFTVRKLYSWIPFCDKRSPAHLSNVGHGQGDQRYRKVEYIDDGQSHKGHFSCQNVGRGHQHIHSKDSQGRLKKGTEILIRFSYVRNHKTTPATTANTITAAATTTIDNIAAAVAATVVVPTTNQLLLLLLQTF